MYSCSYYLINIVWLDFFDIVTIHVGRGTMRANFSAAATRSSRGAENPKQVAQRNINKKEAIRKCDAGFFDEGWLALGDASRLYMSYLEGIGKRHIIHVEDGDEEEEEEEEKEEEEEEGGEEEKEESVEYVSEILDPRDIGEDAMDVEAAATAPTGNIMCLFCTL